MISTESVHVIEQVSQTLAGDYDCDVMRPALLDLALGDLSLAIDQLRGPYRQVTLLESLAAGERDPLVTIPCLSYGGGQSVEDHGLEGETADTPPIAAGPLPASRSTG